MINSGKNRIAILGANGYLGSHVCNALVEQGHSVTAYGTSELPNPNIPEEVPYVQFDICNKNSFSLDHSFDFVYLFSGLTGTNVSFKNYRAFVEVNEIGLLNVLDKLTELAVKPRIIFPSTRLVYEGSDDALSEEATKEAKTIYAANKLNCERLLKVYHDMAQIPYTIFRICVPFGNVLDENYSYGTMGFFLGKAKKGEPITLFGDGSLKRTFTHVSDLCHQLIEASMNPLSINECYNTAGETFSLLEAATLVASKYTVPIEFVPWPEEALKIESGHTVFDSSKIEQILSNPLKEQLHEWIHQL